MEFITTNGKGIKIVPACLKDAMKAKKALMQALKEAGILKDLKFEMKDVQSFLESDSKALMEKIGDIFFALETSEALEKAIFECLKTCIYTTDDNVSRRITPELFDEVPELREDYYEIIVKCLEANLRPFFKSLVSEFKTRLTTITEKAPELKQTAN